VRPKGLKRVASALKKKLPKQLPVKRVKITPNKLIKQGGTYNNSSIEQFQPVSTLNPGYPPSLRQPKKKKGGLKKVCQILKDGAEGGFDQARMLDAVGSSPGAPASELNPGNVGDYIPRVSGKGKKKGKKQ
jgi:hypothetical protein